MAASELRLPAEDPAPPPAAGAAGEGLVPGLLGEGDVDSGLALSDGAGWNQTGDDWRIFIRHGRTIGLRDGKGRWVATAAALPYGNDHGYVSMVLVADDWRHRGLASRLMDDCVAHLRASGIVPLLDATPAGAAVYRRIGFVSGFEIDRWERPARAAPDRPDAPAPALDLEALCDLDRAATGLERRFLLADFLSRPATRAWQSDDGRGFVLARAGRRATQIGPLVAADERQAAGLLATAIDAASDAGRPIFLDLPREHRQLADRLERQGFVRQRPFVRMSLGAGEAPRLGAGLFVLAGPEFG